MHFIYSSLESVWLTSYWRHLNFFRQLLQLRHYKQILVKVGTFQRGGSLWLQILDGRRHAPNQCCCLKTRVFGLPQSKDHMIPSSFVSVQYQHVMDGRTEGFAVDITCFRAYKLTKSISIIFENTAARFFETSCRWCRSHIQNITPT